MRVLMFNKPEVIEAINAFTVPVNPIVPDVVLPDRPIFEPIRRYLETYPFGRVNFAWWMIADPFSQTVLGCEQEKLGLEMEGEGVWSAEYLVSILERAKRIVEIGDGASPELAAERLSLLEESRRQTFDSSLSLTRDNRILTIYWLSEFSWRPLGSLVERIASDPAVFTRGVVNLIIAALAEIVITETPFSLAHRAPLRRLFEKELELQDLPEVERYWKEEDVVPAVFRRKAAEYLETALGMRLRKADESVVDGVRSWWFEHRNDPRFLERSLSGDYSFVTPESAKLSFATCEECTELR